MTLFAVAIAGICLFTACKKDGNFNPKEKISAIYRSGESTSSYGGETQTYTTPKHLTEKWIWDGNKLASIENYDYEIDGNNNVTSELDYIIDFEYDGKQLSKITQRGNSNYYVEFLYDGKKIDKVNGYYRNTLEESFSFEYDGKKISKIILKYFDDVDYAKADMRKINFMKELVLRTVMPDVDAAKKVESIMSRSASKGEENYSTYTYTLTWNGNNISSLSTEEGTMTMTYDNKNNPIKGFLGAIVSVTDATDSGIDFCNENNIVSLTSSSTFEGENFTNTENYTYTYDGKWPVTCTSTESYTDEGYTTSYTRSTYYEYAD